MKVTWAELHERYFLSIHKKNPEKRRSDIRALAVICEVLIREGEILTDSDKPVSIENGNQESYKFPVPGTIIVRWQIEQARKTPAPENILSLPAPIFEKFRP